MKIENYRKKSYFFRIFLLSRMLEEKLILDLRDYELTIAESLCLVAIFSENNGEVILTQLSKTLSYKKSLISHSISKIESFGLIKRNICNEDKRRYRLVITEKGVRLVPKLMKIFDRHDNWVENQITQLEKTSLDKCFSKYKI